MRRRAADVRSTYAVRILRASTTDSKPVLPNGLFCDAARELGGHIGALFIPPFFRTAEFLYAAKRLGAVFNPFALLVTTQRSLGRATG